MIFVTGDRVNRRRDIQDKSFYYNARVHYFIGVRCQNDRPPV